LAQAAYALKEAWADASNYEVGGIMKRDGTEMLNVGQLLRDGNGYIVTDDEPTQEALDSFDPLKRVAVSEAEGAQKKGSKKSDDKDDDS
jgi:hypothetical protein